MTKPLLSLLLSLSAITAISAQVHINEWMASNSSVIEDPDFDETGDWIELYNSSDNEVNLKGYYLSDNLDNPTKWQISELYIASKGYLLIWADGADQGSHANFKLTKEGEAIGLYDQDTTIIDLVEYAHQKTNISMGRRSEGSADLGFFAEPTPGAPNAQLSYAQLTFYEPRFSKTGGFYSEPIEVELRSIEGDIYYTLDGSLPQTDDLLYTTPIELSTTTVLRAVSILPDQLPGKAITHSYFFDSSLADRGLPVVSIVSEPDYFWDEQTGIYVQDFKPPWRYPINIELFENDGSDRAAFSELAGIKVNGLNSWVLPQKMLGIYFDNDYDSNNLDYQLFFDRDRKQYDNFILRASGNDWSNTLFRDALAQQLTADNMDIERMGYRPAIAFINGAYMGIHNLRSRIDESFVEDNFGYSGSEYDLIENDGIAEQGDTIAYAEMRNLFYSDLSNQDNYQQLLSKVDIQNFMDYFITEMWSSNSSYGHNIQLWKPKAADTKWRWIFTDLDRGMARSDRYGLEYFMGGNNPVYDYARTFLSNVIKNDNFRTQFISRFADHLYTTFHPHTVENTITDFAELIAPELPYHVEKWGNTTSAYGNGIGSVEYWEEEVAELKQFAYDRPSFILDELKTTFGLEETVALSLYTHPASAGTMTINELPVPSTSWTGPYFKSLPIQLTAIPNEGFSFLGWLPTTNEELIRKEATWQYLDNGSDPGNDWNQLTFDASGWNVNRGQFGYGDDDERTIIDYGSDQDNKHITTYFRRFVEVELDQKKVVSLDFQLLRDDGAVVYLNGKELYRSNMPEGDINYLTLASAAMASPQEDTYYSFSVSPEYLIQGTNLIAVEIHQQNNTSSDLSFDLEMSMTMTEGDNYISTNEVLDMELSEKNTLVASYQSLDHCRLEGPILVDTRLTKECSPYLVTEDVLVSENVTLTVEPGVELQFGDEVDLIVNGRLTAEGTEAEPVIMTTYARAAAWGGLIFSNATDTSRLAWLELSQASQGNHPIYENAAISAFHSILEIDHLIIEEVYNNPILGYYSDISLQNSSLHSAVTGDLINIKYGKGLVHNCTFRGNNRVDTDAIDYDEVEGGIISNNRIYNFLGFNSDGIDLGEVSKDVLVQNNLIYNCTDKGISVGQESTVRVEDNVLVNCNQGIALKDLSIAEIHNNTFYNVGIPIACFEKSVGIGGGTAFASNCILSNTPVSTTFVDEHSTLEMQYMLSDTDTLMMSEGIYGHPRFQDPTHFDFRLMSTSAALTAGVDEDGEPVDLGSRFFHEALEPTVLISAIQYNPLENGDAEFIDIHNPSTQKIDLESYVLSGAVELVFPDLDIRAGETIRLVKDANLFPVSVKKLIQWETGKLSNKGELIRLSDSNGIIIDQVIYDDSAPWPTAADGEGSFLRLVSTALDNHFAESWIAGNTTTVDEQALTPVYSLGPNPVQAQLTLSSDNHELRTVRIFDAVGRPVRVIYPRGGKRMDIDVHTLSEGYYYLLVNGETSLPFVKIN